MTKRYLPNFVHTYNITPCHSDQASCLHFGTKENFLGRKLRHIRNHFAEIRRAKKLENEIQRDTEHLYSLTDEQLRDIGITRMDIPRAVRFGKESL